MTRILARVFAYLPSFISQILDFIYWPVLILILIYFELRDTENQQLIWYVSFSFNWTLSHWLLVIFKLITLLGFSFLLSINGYYYYTEHNLCTKQLPLFSNSPWVTSDHETEGVTTWREQNLPDFQWQEINSHQKLTIVRLVKWTAGNKHCKLVQFLSHNTLNIDHNKRSLHCQ